MLKYRKQINEIHKSDYTKENHCTYAMPILLLSGPEIQSLLATSSDPYSIKVEWSVDQRVLLYTAVTGYLVNVTSSDTILDVRIITSQASTVHYSHAVSSLQPSTEYSITTCAVLESGDHGPTNSTTVRTGEYHSQNRPYSVRATHRTDLTQ